MHYVKSVRILSYSDPHFPTYSISFRSHSEYGKMQTRTTIPNTDTFYAVMLFITFRYIVMRVIYFLWRRAVYEPAKVLVLLTITWYPFYVRTRSYAALSWPYHLSKSDQVNSIPRLVSFLSFILSICNEHIMPDLCPLYEIIVHHFFGPLMAGKNVRIQVLVVRVLFVFQILHST